MIRNASNLRLGNAQKRVVAESRECIKSNTTNRIPMVSITILISCVLDIAKRIN